MNGRTLISYTHFSCVCLQCVCILSPISSLHTSFVLYVVLSSSVYTLIHESVVFKQLQCCSSNICSTDSNARWKERTVQTSRRRSIRNELFDIHLFLFFCLCSFFFQYGGTIDALLISADRDGYIPIWQLKWKSIDTRLTGNEICGR